MPQHQCIVCGKTFFHPPRRARPPVVCSPECKKTRHADASRKYYAAQLERQGKARTHGSAQYGELRCDVEGCDGKYYAKGMCNKHYAQARRKTDPESGNAASRRYRERAKALPRRQRMDRRGRA